jgi:hypothetical protein
MEGNYGDLNSNYICDNGTTSMNAMRLYIYSDSLANRNDFRKKVMYITNR